MASTISKLLDEWVPKGEFDFANFAANFPIAVMCSLLGVTPESTEKLHDALETQVSSVSLAGDILPKLIGGYRTMFAYADSVIAEREAKGGSGEDLIGALIDAKNAGKLDDKELRHMLIVLLLGGYDTSKNMLTMVVYLAMQRPDVWTRCAQDPAYCRSVVEEALRHSGLLVPFRVATQDIEYDDVLIPAGTMLCFALPLTGRDPDAFDDPENFDPERKFTNRHFAFGRGEHTCIGQHLARVQIEEGLHQITQRLKNPRITGEIERRPFLGAGGLRTLPISFDPAPASTKETSS
jgi:cytochrome P450